MSLGWIESCPTATARYADGATIIMNGPTISEGRDEIRQFHERMFGSITEHKLTKTFRTVTGNVIGVQWHTESIDDNGKWWVQDAGEFWTMENGKLKVWEAHAPAPGPRDSRFTHCSARRFCARILTAADGVGTRSRTGTGERVAVLDIAACGQRLAPATKVATM